MSGEIFYVYEHWRPDTDHVFYVGKGKNRRAWHMDKRNQHHRNVVKKLAGNVRVVIVADLLSEECAFVLEKERIAHWRALNHPLVNITDGGEGASGMRMPEAVKAKISEKHKGKTLSPHHREKLSAAQRRRYANPDERARAGERSRGRKASPETIAKRAAKLRGRKMPQSFCDAIGDRMRGKLVSEDTRAKIRAALTGRRHSDETRRLRQMANSLNKPVLCVNTGEVYISASEAARELGVSKTHVAEICRGAGARKSAKGYKFEYVSRGEA